jgi:3-phenylpropionate/trans-cinnamate dioxygenase ferredoxin component
MVSIKVARTDELKSGEHKVLDLGTRALVVFNVDGKFFAIDERCPHKGGPLGEGLVDGLTVKCPWHGAVFSLEDGHGVSGPCGNGVNCYPVTINGSDIEVEVTDN